MKNFTSKTIDHLGIVAALCQEIGIVNIIDQLIVPDKRAKLTTGECAKLMIINGLGFSSRPLYLQAQFYSSKPVERLLARQIKVEDITDDALGRSLDRLFEANCEMIFSEIASRAADYFKVDTHFRSLDTTTMHVHGEYEQGIGLVTFGYSKDNLPNLKQFIVSLMSSQDGDVPLLAQTIAGNSSDKKHFRQVLKQLQEQIKRADHPFYYVADSALYNQETIKEISFNSKWITRVPQTLRESRQMVRDIKKEEMVDLGQGYYSTERKSSYGEVEQRWVIVFTQKGYAKAAKTVEKDVKRSKIQAEKELRRICSRTYSCHQDALKDIEAFGQKLVYHHCREIQVDEQIKMEKVGRPKSTDVGKQVYKLSCQLVENWEQIELAKQSRSKFIIATNELDSSRLTQEELVTRYKKQQSVERGFRFLKDPLFMTSSVYLKNQKRIVALGMIMCLCLLVYMLAQRKLRLELERHNESLPDQKGKLTKLPTMRWIYQIFEGVHILYYQTEESSGKLSEVVLNLNPLRIKVLQLLGPPYLKLYQDAA